MSSTSEATSPSRPTGETAHRPDIDGLRAVAVLPVVGFHAGIYVLSGGFVGVDVFFVISGYLISGVLFKEMAAGKFSIARFYERRIRRIFPALFATFVGTFIMAWHYSLPSELIDLAKSCIAAILSVSNIHFWMQAGYFDGSALSKPLLHTWSLAVEEQFYIFWPLILLAAYRFAKHRIALITIGIFTASFVLSAITAFTSKDAAYYLVPSRAWELAIGAILALQIVRAPSSALARELMAAGGLVMILASVFLINGDMPFPGVVALPPTLGAAMIILAGTNAPLTWTGRLLSWKPVTFIGLISYSLYLWHWPISVFEHNNGMLLGSAPDRDRKIAIIVVSIVAATLSWKFIEQPFRTGKYRPSARTLGWLAAAATAAGIVFSMGVWQTGGAPSRFNAEAIRLASYLQFQPAEMYRDGTCFLRERVGESAVKPVCVQQDASRPNYLILGDSHAAQLWWGLSRTTPEINFMQITGVGCLPTITPKAGEVERCRTLMQRTFDDLIKQHNVDKVLITGRWITSSLPAIEATLDWAATHQVPVALLGPVPVYDSPLPRLLARAQITQPPLNPNEHWDRSLADLDKAMATVAVNKGIPYISAIDILCPQGNCVTLTEQGTPMMFDKEHFTPEGSEMFARALAEKLRTNPTARLTPQPTP